MKKRDPRMNDRYCDFITVHFFFGRDDDIIELIKKEAKNYHDYSAAAARIIRRIKSLEIQVDILKGGD